MIKENAIDEKAKLGFLFLERLKSIKPIESAHILLFIIELVFLIITNKYKRIIPIIDPNGNSTDTVSQILILGGILVIVIYYYVTTFSLERTTKIFSIDFIIRTLTAFLIPISLFFLLEEMNNITYLCLIFLTFLYLIWDYLFIKDYIKDKNQRIFFVLSDVSQLFGLLVLIILPSIGLTLNFSAGFAFLLLIGGPIGWFFYYTFGKE